MNCFRVLGLRVTGSDSRKRGVEGLTGTSSDSVVQGNQRNQRLGLI